MTATSFRTHYFDSTGEAYNASQTGYYPDYRSDVRVEVQDGDLLVVPNEGVYGFLYEAWPVAVSSDRHGEFHTVLPTFWEDQTNAEKYLEVLRAAWSLDQLDHDQDAEV